MTDLTQAREIRREGRTTGRWPRYQLIVDGKSVGTIRRVISQGCDRLAGNPHYDSWEAAGLRQLETREQAEAWLLERAERCEGVCRGTEHERPPTLRFTATDVNGTVIESVPLCADCALALGWDERGFTY